MPLIERCVPAIACLTGLVVVLPGAARADWYGESIDLMGTRVSVELWDDDAADGDRLVAAVLDEYRRIDELMSTYKADSEISRVNAQAADHPVEIGRELYSLVERSLGLSEASGGAFDISYESVGYLYDFREHRHPTEAQIQSGLPAINYRHIHLDPDRSTIRFERPGMRINLGGIAKGYAVARGAQILESNGIRHALLNAGGDTRVLGDRRGKPWIIGIRHPRLDDAVVTRLPLVNEAISTSGDYERYFEEDGRRYHHIINPTTGEPTNGLLSVTVIGPDSTLTDGLSTTLFVLGAERGLELIESFEGYEAVIVASDGGVSFSSGLVEPD